MPQVSLEWDLLLKYYLDLVYILSIYGNVYVFLTNTESKKLIYNIRIPCRVKYFRKYISLSVISNML